MTFGTRKLARFLRRFRKREEGSPTVEFVLLFMPIIVITMTGLELGLLMTRHVMMERGLDMAVREVRLNTGAPINEDQFKQLVCSAAGIIPSCMNNLRLEMRPINMRHQGSNSSNTIPRRASCTDVDSPFEPARNFTNGSGNEVMVVRACGLFRPMIAPGLGLAHQLNQGPQGFYRLVATTAFVMEPV